MIFLIFLRLIFCADVSKCENYAALDGIHSVIKYETVSEPLCLELNSSFFFSDGEFDVDVAYPQINATTNEVYYISLGKDKNKPLGFISSFIFKENKPLKARVSITSSAPVVIDIVQVSRNFVHENTEHSFFVNTNKLYKHTLRAGRFTNETSGEKCSSESVLVNINTEDVYYMVQSGNQSVDFDVYDANATQPKSTTVEANTMFNNTLKGIAVTTLKMGESADGNSECSVTISALNQDRRIPELFMEMSGEPRYIDYEVQRGHEVNDLRDALIGVTASLVIILSYILLYVCYCRKEDKKNHNHPTNGWREINDKNFV